jgi:hypothetical protein
MAAGNVVVAEAGTGAVLIEVALERERQEVKFPGQVLRHYTPRTERLAPPAEVARDECEHRHAEGACSWYDVLLEEVAEALDEAVAGNHPAAPPEWVELLRAELVQVAAVAVRWIEQIDRGEP